MIGQPGSIARRPPHGNGTGEPGETFSSTVTSASQTFAVIPSGAPLAQQQGSWMTFVSSVDCYVRFGSGAVAAATTNDAPMFAGVKEEWFCSDTLDNTFSVLRAGAVDGVIKRYRSDRH